MKKQPRFSRQRYRGFVEDYRRRRLDEPVDAAAGKPAASSPTAIEAPVEAAPTGGAGAGSTCASTSGGCGPHRYAVAAVFGFAVLVAALEMIEPLFMRFINDRILLDAALDQATRLSRLRVAGALFFGTVPGGSVVALVGRSGAGRTTVTDLVARFHDPTEGRILLNRSDIREVRLRSYRDLLAIVQQEVFLFDGSVHDNTAYSRHDATSGEIEDAARRANAHEFIVRLPEQYETFVGERGVKLSGGQQQRLAIARSSSVNSNPTTPPIRCV
jgi:ABC-type bacteriocin/lantibiotic exporter with double-glycine peptidase domain